MTSNDRVHAPEKPLPLMTDLVRRITTKRRTVLDPRMGSDSTGEACPRRSVGFIGAEIDPKYFRAAAKRLRSASDCRAEVCQL